MGLEKLGCQNQLIAHHIYQDNRRPSKLITIM